MHGWQRAASAPGWEGESVEPVDLQFFSFFVVVLSGLVLGFLFDLLRAIRGHWGLSGCLAAASDALFWAVATFVISLTLLLGNWGEFRFFMVVGVAVGLALHFWLASRTTIRVARVVLHLLDWVWDTLCWLVMRLVVAPILLLFNLLMVVGRLCGTFLEWIGRLLWRPLRSTYRCMRLRWLLAKRRIKRKLRRWLLPPDGGKPPRS